MNQLPIKQTVQGVTGRVGQGAHGSVYDVGGGNVAKVVELDEGDGGVEERVLEEIEVLRKLSHPGVVRLVEAYRVGGWGVVVVTEKAMCGDLETQIHNRIKTAKSFTNHETLLIATQLAMAVSAVHRAGYSHNDIKPTNIFLNKSGVVQLGDFGVATPLHTTTNAAALRGTPYYLPPEIWSSMMSDVELPSTDKADVWSLGIVLYEVETLERPFRADQVEDLADKVMNGACNEALLKDDEVRSVVSLILEKDPAVRLSAEGLLSTKYLQRGLRAFEAAVKFSPKIPDDVKNAFAVEITKFLNRQTPTTPPTMTTSLLKISSKQSQPKPIVLSLTPTQLVLSPPTRSGHPGHSLCLAEVVQAYPTPTPCVFGLETKTKKTHLFKSDTPEAAAQWVDAVTAALEYLNVNAA